MYLCGMRKIFLTLACFTLLLLGSCNKKCGNLESTNSGSIQDTYTFGDCNYYGAIDSHMVIRTQQEFNDFVAKQFQFCSEQNTIPSVDFAKSSLIALMVSTPACNIAYKRSLDLDIATKTYTYTVTTDKCTGCNQLLRSPNFVLTDPIPANYSVKFVIND